MTRARGLSTNRHGIYQKQWWFCSISSERTYTSSAPNGTLKYCQQVLPALVMFLYSQYLQSRKLKNGAPGNVELHLSGMDQCYNHSLYEQPNFRCCTVNVSSNFFRLFNYAFQWPHDVTDFPISMDECQIFSNTTLAIRGDHKGR